MMLVELRDPIKATSDYLSSIKGKYRQMKITEDDCKAVMGKWPTTVCPKVCMPLQQLLSSIEVWYHSTMQEHIDRFRAIVTLQEILMHLLDKNINWGEMIFLQKINFFQIILMIETYKYILSHFKLQISSKNSTGKIIDFEIPRILM